MRITERDHKRIISLAPGEFFVSREAVTICTLLGSCVAACIYDAVNGVMGMNHFLLSNRRYSKQMPMYLSEAGKYGMHAMELLINGMLKEGAERKHLRAKAFGGATMYRSPDRGDNFFCVGDVNARFIREYLQNDGIPLVSQDLGGEAARVIRFQRENFSVYLKRISTAFKMDIVQQEKDYWKKIMETQEHEKTRMELWE